MHRRYFALVLALVVAISWLLIWNAAITAQGALPPGAFPGPCSRWVPVSEGAFGLGTGSDDDYAAEEGFEVTTFAGQLYVGMEADNAMGARLWRTRPGVAVPVGQDDWEEVAADGDGHPFGNPHRQQNDHVDSLAVFQGTLYASTANRSGTLSGTLIYSSATGAPGSWTQVISPGFGDVENQNFKDMVTFTVESTAWLCGGTSNDAAGAQIWCTADGAHWEQKNVSGFGSPANTLVASTGVFSGALYAGVANDAGGSLWRTDDLVTWTQVLTAGLPRVEFPRLTGGALYVAAGAYDGRNASDPAIRVYRSPSGDPGSWQEVGGAVSADPHNTRTIVDGAATYNGALYLATMNAATGAEVWRTVDGTHWEQVNAGGFGQTSTFAAELIPFNGYLYAWTSDYAEGQRVYRTACPICQAAPVTGTGRYALPGAGATFTLTAGTLDAVTVCVRPGAFPTGQGAPRPVARTYAITVAPPTAAFTADLALSYTGGEFAAGDVAAEDSLYLTHWTGSAWQGCPAEKRGIAPVSETVLCRDVNAAPTTWAIAGEGGAPTRAGLTAPAARSPASLALSLALLAAAIAVWVSGCFEGVP